MTEAMDQTFIEWLREHSSNELGYVFLIALLFIIPRFLLRAGIPMALTSFSLGILVSSTIGFYAADNVISLFSTLGIISLFLFAGMDVDLSALKREIRPITTHIIFRSTVIIAVSVILYYITALPIVTSVILTLAMVTPSTGFILDNIDTSNMPESQKFWIKLKAISAELVALGALLVFSQLESMAKLFGSILVIIALIVILPLLLKRLTATLERLAPGSEFGFILMLAIIAGIITKKLGAYYLVGAFLVGMAAGQFKRQSPSENTSQTLHSLRSFSAFFMPFYFFNSGLGMPLNAFSYTSLMIAFVFFVVSVPLKIGTILLHRRVAFGETWKESLAISVSLMPNLVFGLVLADILKNKFNLPVEIYGGLIIYTLLATALSPLFLKFIPKPKDINFDLIAADPSSL
jgi:Kef-type K+ transport system membrane component KefB